MPFRLWRDPVQILQSGNAGSVECNSPDFSVCVETHGGWICVAEFRTHHEAMSLAEAAADRSGLHAMIRRSGQTIADLQPAEHSRP